MQRSFTLITALLSVLTLQVMAQIPSFPQPNRQNVRLDATIQNRMSNEEFMLRIAEIRQQQEQNAVADKREAAKLCASQTVALYNSVNTYPVSIADGWYNISFTDDQPSCGTRKAYVENNRVSKWTTASGIYNLNTVFSSPITKGKSLVRLQLDDGTESDMINVYFLENSIDPSARAAAPQSGKISFWTNYKKMKEPIKIYVFDELLGELNSYFEVQPNCEQKELLRFIYKPGVYNYTAKSANITWSGTFEIVNGQCSLHCLSRK